MFSHRPTDLRYDSVEFQEFFTTNSLVNATRLQFSMPRFTGPYLYLPSQMILRVSVNLTQEDGSAIPDTVKLAPINNILHSLVSSVSLRVNNTPLNDFCELYSHKAYIIDLLSYDSAAKWSFLQAQGWYQDTEGTFDQINLNSGFNQRMRLFQKKVKSGTSTKYVYHGENCVFMGRLHTDLASCQSGLGPGVALTVDIGLNRQEFFLQTEAAEKCKLNIKQVSLLIPVAQISADLFRKIERSLAEKEASVYFTRVQMTSKNLPKGNRTYSSENLFSTSQLPARLIVVFVLSDSLAGTFKSNPYNFGRMWVMPDDEASGSTWSLTGGGGGGSDSGDKKVWIERAVLKLNGKNIDGLEGRATEFDDTCSYYRLHHYLALTQSRSGNNVTMSEFLKGMYCLVWDLSTSSMSGNLEYVIPSVRTGNLRLHIEFSQQLEIDLTAIFYAEFPSLMRIDHHRRVHLSYVA